MKENIQVEKLLDKAISELPFLNLISSKTENLNRDQGVRYLRDCRFDLCPLLHEFLIGEGYIEYSQHADNPPDITASCFISVQGDNQRKSELGIFDYLGGAFNLDTAEWNFSVDLSMLE